MVHQETALSPWDALDLGLMIYRYLQKRAHEAFAQRRLTYEGLETAGQIAAYQERLHAFFLETLGGFPERTPLHAQIVGELPGDGYRVEKVIFQSQPGHMVTAAMYIPDAPAPHPGVLVPCGHSAEGKATDFYQRACILLAQNGLAALCYDPIGQGERSQLLDDAGQPKYGCTWEHTVLGVGAILLGTNTARYRIYDGMRALDYLTSRPDIDPERIGCTGNSGGGTLTSFLMALDPRIFCAAPSCFLTSLRRLVDIRLPQDAEQNLFREIAGGMEHADFLIMRAPKPTLMCTATRDYFDIAGSWDTFRQAKRIYTRLGFAERVDLVETDATHGFTVQLREAAVRWMKRWLLEQDEHVVEGPLAPYSVIELQGTPHGQVLLEPDARSAFQLNAEMDARFAADRRALWQRAPGEALDKVRAAVGVPPLSELASCESYLVSVVAREGYTIERLLLGPEAGITLPALLFRPAQPGEDTCLYLHGEGKEADAGDGGPITVLVTRGYTVLAADMRGLGDEDWGKIHRNYFLAYRLGMSYLGMRTADTLALGQFLQRLGGDRDAQAAPRRVHLVGVGEAGPVALHAAALEPDLFATVTLRRSLHSWSRLVQDGDTPLSQLMNAVHGALRSYDLPDLMASLPPDRITIQDPVDAFGRPVAS